MVFVGDVQGSKHGQTHGIDGVGGLGNGAHLGVNVFGSFRMYSGSEPRRLYA